MIVPFAVLVFAVILLRLLLPTLLVKSVNDRLRQISPMFSFHVKDMDVHILKGEYVLKNVEGFIKTTHTSFLSIQDVTAQIPWRNLLKASKATTLVINKLELIAFPEVLSHAQETLLNLKNASLHEYRFKINNITLLTSQIDFKGFLTTKKGLNHFIQDTNATIINLHPTAANPVTSFVVTASIFGPTPFRAAGEARFNQIPLQWDVNAETRNLNLLTVDELIEEQIGLKIENGFADLYSEIASTGGNLHGYVKPFISELRVAQRTVGDGHVAFKLPVSDQFKTFAKALQDDRNLLPGIEDIIGHKGLEIKQAQEFNNDRGTTWQQQQLTEADKRRLRRKSR